MKKSEIIDSSLTIRDKLKHLVDYKENPIDVSLSPVPPFRGADSVSLIVLGQDPTIKNHNSRKNITCTLNLDKKGSLKTYLSEICKGLGITIENVYATNVFKYFYSKPPAKALHILQQHLPENLNLVKKELVQFPDAIIIALGEPVLQLLAGTDKHVRDFWAYNKATKQSNGLYSLCPAKENLLGRDFFPFPHQPSISKEFYKNHLGKYVDFVKGRIEIENR
ncbi:MAG: hypothetical protein K9H64_22040 [Bacteroidales bacterium]|nr:hypothetical protein [Bacteroidales bacterium]MCF8458703.1 hypothetical protein [Bacteroidales bacterium]